MSAVPHDESASSTLVRDDLVIDSESTWEGGRQAFQTAWMAGARPTAVLAMSDIVALGAASAAGALRLAVPADLSIVGFDDIPSAADPPRSLHIRFLVCILLYPPRHHCALRGAGNRCARSETLFSTRFLPPRFQGAEDTALQATYILPIRRNRLHPRDDLTDYVRWLSHHLEVVIVDGSPSDIFTAHAEAWGPGVRHMALDPDLSTPNGKVGGVMTGLRAASHDRVVIADDDVRYDLPALQRIVDLLELHAAVRPQNYFRPLPWHAQLDTARTLLNRMFGGDWPGTLGVRAEFFRAAGGYDGSVLFENLELIRTIGAVGGDEIVPLDLYVQRRPPDASHFFSQRLRQAYDEWARPARMLVFLAILPLSAILMRRHRPALGAFGLAAVGLAEAGRRRAAGASVFPARCSLLAPIWLLERAICIWLALGARLLLGGVPYHGSLLTRAATPARTLRRRHRAAGHGLRAVAA